MRKFKLIKELFPIGTVLEDGLKGHQDYGEQYEVIVGIGKDFIAHLILDKDTVESNPEYFEEVK